MRLDQGQRLHPATGRRPRPLLRRQTGAVFRRRRPSPSFGGGARRAGALPPGLRIVRPSRGPRPRPHALRREWEDAAASRAARTAAHDGLLGPAPLRPDWRRPAAARFLEAPVLAGRAAHPAPRGGPVLASVGQGPARALQGSLSTRTRQQTARPSGSLRRCEVRVCGVGRPRSTRHRAVEDSRGAGSVRRCARLLRHSNQRGVGCGRGRRDKVGLRRACCWRCRQASQHCHGRQASPPAPVPRQALVHGSTQGPRLPSDGRSVCKDEQGRDVHTHHTSPTPRKRAPQACSGADAAPVPPWALQPLQPRSPGRSGNRVGEQGLQDPQAPHRPHILRVPIVAAVQQRRGPLDHLEA